MSYGFFLIYCSIVLFTTANAISLFNFLQSQQTNIHAVSRPVTTFHASTPHSSLFGKPAITPAPSSVFVRNYHPRIIVDKTGWENLLDVYANEEHFNRDGSWSYHLRSYTLLLGPYSPHIDALSKLAKDPVAYLYDGTVDYTNITQAQKNQLVPLVKLMSTANEVTSQSFFMCALWTSVNERRMSQGHPSFLTVTSETCIDATVVWAKVLLAHRAYHCGDWCPGPVAGHRAYVWGYYSPFAVSDEWYTGMFTIALVYDVMYDKLTVDQRRIIRSAIAMLVLKKWSWGNSPWSDRIWPNAQVHPHRIFSNWALYHSNLYLANLAIEGETDFDAYATSVLRDEGEIGFNSGLNERFRALIDAYMKHSFYPDGMTFEDGYSYFIALREGSLGLVAAQRRGLNVLDTDRFRNIIHNAAQMMEPWQCGRLIGHASGGGESYPAWAGLIRYAYPDGVLSGMIWRQRFGEMIKNNNPCRIQWHQTMQQMTFLGGEHAMNTTKADSPGTLEDVHKEKFPLSFYGTRRGLLIARSGYSENHCYIHFDARPDAFFPGHDNADRGVFTYSAYHQTWIDEYPWRENIDSRKHSLLHVDGLAQDEKAPSVRMTTTQDDGEVVLASANLTYAYNVQWARNWPDHSAPYREVNVYGKDGNLQQEYKLFSEKETGDPRDFGWPADDDGADIGFARPESNMNGDVEVGFRGMFTWKRAYREERLRYVVRSVALVRSEVGIGYFLLCDSVATGDDEEHVYESYLMLHDQVTVNEGESSCEGSTCKIILENGLGAKTEILAVANAALGYRWEAFESDRTHTRVVIRGDGGGKFDMYMAFNTYTDNRNGFAMTKTERGVKSIYGTDRRYFEIDGSTRELVAGRPSSVDDSKPAATATATATATPSATASSSTPTVLAMSPMPPIPLALRKRPKLTLSDFSNAPSSYLTTDTYTHQKVFSITSRSRVSRLDRISTCFSYTGVATQVAIYECADYGRRDCGLVDAASRNCGVKNGGLNRTSWAGKLEFEKVYYVVLSANTTAMGEIRVRIQHSVMTKSAKEDAHLT